MKPAKGEKAVPNKKAETCAPLPKLRPLAEQFSFMRLTGFGVSCEDAAQAIASARSAKTRLFMLSVFGKPELPAKSPQSMERLHFYLIKAAAERASAPDAERKREHSLQSLIAANPALEKEVNEMMDCSDALLNLLLSLFGVKNATDGSPATGLLNLLLSPTCSGRIRNDFAGFIRRLHKFMESSKTGSHTFDKIDELLVGLWTRATETLPPFCLLTSPFLSIVLNLPEDAIRQRKSRLKLFTPSRPQISAHEVYRAGKKGLRVGWKREGKAETDEQWRTFFSEWTVEPSERDKADDQTVTGSL